MSKRQPFAYFHTSYSIMKSNVKSFSSLPVNQRYKPHHKYEYKYFSESMNPVNSAPHLMNGHQISCKVNTISAKFHYSTFFKIHLVLIVFLCTS